MVTTRFSGRVYRVSIGVLTLASTAVLGSCAVGFDDGVIATLRPEVIEDFPRATGGPSYQLSIPRKLFSSPEGLQRAALPDGAPLISLVLKYSAFAATDGIAKDRDSRSAMRLRLRTCQHASKSDATARLASVLALPSHNRYHLQQIGLIGALPNSVATYTLPNARQGARVYYFTSDGDDVFVDCVSIDACIAYKSWQSTLLVRYEFRPADIVDLRAFDRAINRTLESFQVRQVSSI